MKGERVIHKRARSYRLNEVPDDITIVSLLVKRAFFLELCDYPVDCIHTLVPFLRIASATGIDQSTPLQRLRCRGRSLGSDVEDPCCHCSRQNLYNSIVSRQDRLDGITTERPGWQTASSYISCNPSSEETTRGQERSDEGYVDNDTCDSTDSVSTSDDTTFESADCEGDDSEGLLRACRGPGCLRRHSLRAGRGLGRLGRHMSHIHECASV